MLKHPASAPISITSRKGGDSCHPIMVLGNRAPPPTGQTAKPSQSREGGSFSSASRKAVGLVSPPRHRPRTRGGDCWTPNGRCHQPINMLLDLSATNYREERLRYRRAEGGNRCKHRPRPGLGPHFSFGYGEKRGLLSWTREVGTQPS